MHSVNIIGAGLSGLLAATMLRQRATIYEAQKELPHNHSALLRFRSNAFSTAVGIPFRKVRMIKGVYGDNSNPIKNMIQYSMKTTGQARTDRSLMQTFIQEDRYIAPSNLIEQLAQGLDIKYNSILRDGDGIDFPTISTIPMPKLMDILGYPHKDKVEFKHRAGVNITAIIDDCDAYATFYYPNSSDGAYRASITGNQIIVEFTDTIDMLKNSNWFSDDNAVNIATFYARHFGFTSDQVAYVEVKKQQYAKILPIDDEIRKDFMHWATDRHNIYSLGRFATWRPGLLLDDLVQDVSLISQWIRRGGKYGAAKHRAKAESFSAA